MVTYDNHRSGTWTAFLGDDNCVGVITKKAPNVYILDTFGQKYMFSKLRRAKRWLQTKLLTA